MGLLRKSWGAREDRAPLSDDLDPDDEVEGEDEYNDSLPDDGDEDEEDDDSEDDLEDDDDLEEPGEHVERGEPVVEEHRMYAIELTGAPLLFVPADHVTGSSFTELEDFLPVGTRAEDLVRVTEQTGWFASKLGLDKDGDAIDWVGPFTTEAEAKLSLRE